MVQCRDLNLNLHEQGQGLSTCELLADTFENSKQPERFVEVEPDLSGWFRRLPGRFRHHVLTFATTSVYSCPVTSSSMSSIDPPRPALRDHRSPARPLTNKFVDRTRSGAQDRRRFRSCRLQSLTLPVTGDAPPHRPVRFVPSTRRSVHAARRLMLL